MILLEKNFYKIQSLDKQGEGKYGVVIFLNKEHDIFKGHFPGNPVTPGACMIQIIKELTSQILGVEIQMKSTQNVKFMALINPEINPELLLELDINSEDLTAIKVKNIAKFGDTVALKMSNVYTKIRG
jgi:3-hydroxyacyl-[acyl-carrier-protein] dehydratase